MKLHYMRRAALAAVLPITLVSFAGFTPLASAAYGGRYYVGMPHDDCMRFASDTWGRIHAIPDGRNDFRWDDGGYAWRDGDGLWNYSIGGDTFIFNSDGGYLRGGCDGGDRFGRDGRDSRAFAENENFNRNRFNESFTNYSRSFDNTSFRDNIRFADHRDDRRDGRDGWRRDGDCDRRDGHDRHRDGHDGRKDW